MSSYEIEIKSLLGSKDNADMLRAKILEKFGPSNSVKSKQLNHYFVGGDMKLLEKNFLPMISQDKVALFGKIVGGHGKTSVRTRRTDTDTILVIKASIDDTTSENGIARIEFEEKFPNMTLDELDKLLLDSEFSYQAKWSRDREEYSLPELHICLDKNAGYGYLAEFEKVVGDESESTESQKRLRDLMQELGVEELKQDRLERMFSYYNSNWPDYYGTEKIFNIE